MTLRLTEDEAARLSVLFHDAFGWELGPEARVLFETRLKRRVAELSLPSFSEYAWLLTYDRRRADELQQVADLLTTRETYFYREAYQLRALSEEIFPAIARARSGVRQVRIWSAGCASGEEAYTLAMLAAECPAFAGWPIEVFGSDIAPAALAAARLGEYEGASLRELPPSMLRRWLVEKEHPPGRFAVGDRLRECVRFGAVNLATDAGPPGPFDVIVCRNVTIYFSASAKKRLARRFWNALHPCGWLLLGHAESLVSVTSDFELVTLKNDLVYRRPS